MVSMYNIRQVKYNTINMGRPFNHLMAAHYLRNVCVWPHTHHAHSQLKNGIQFANKSQRMQLNLNM